MERMEALEKMITQVQNDAVSRHEELQLIMAMKQSFSQEVTPEEPPFTPVKKSR